MEYLLKFGAFYNLLFAIFHIFFWKIFKWHFELPKLNHLNRAIVQVLNLCLIFCFVLFFVVSFFCTHELPSTNLGRTITAGISLFWLLRALEQIMFFNIRRIESKIFFIIFLGGSIIYAVPLFV